LRTVDPRLFGGAAVATAMALATCSGGVDRDAYVETNEELLATVPVSPGAGRSDPTSSPYRVDDGQGDPSGYTTTYHFSLPSTATRQASARFYKKRLARHWVLAEELVEGGDRVVNFRREDAFLSVNLENRGILELSADHDSYGKPGFPE
jgi:hypothetical protein